VFPSASSNPELGEYSIKELVDPCPQVLCFPIASSNPELFKSLGVTIDSNLRFDCHARNVAKACNFHNRALRHVRSLLTDDVAQKLCAASSLPGWTTAMHC